MSKPAVKGISGSRIRRKRAFETPSDEQTSVGVHVGLNCVYFQVRGTLIDGKNKRDRFTTKNWSRGNPAHHHG